MGDYTVQYLRSLVDEVGESLRLELGRCLERVVSHGLARLGLEISHVWSPHPELLSAFFCWEA